MSVTDKAQKAIQKKLAKVSEQIEAEMQNFVAPHSASGDALAAIHIEYIDEYTRFVGGTNGTGTGTTGTDHLKLLNDGNGTGGIPKNGKPKKPMPLTYGYRNEPPRGYAMHVSNYPPTHFVEKISKKHGGSKID